MKIYFDKENFYSLITNVAIFLYISSLLLGFSGVGFEQEFVSSFSQLADSIGATLLINWYGHLLLISILMSSHKLFNFVLSLGLIIYCIFFIWLVLMNSNNPEGGMYYLLQMVTSPMYITAFLLIISFSRFLLEVFYRILKK